MDTCSSIDGEFWEFQFKIEGRVYICFANLRISIATVNKYPTQNAKDVYTGSSLCKYFIDNHTDAYFQRSGRKLFLRIKRRRVPKEKESDKADEKEEG